MRGYSNAAFRDRSLFSSFKGSFNINWRPSLLARSFREEKIVSLYGTRFYDASTIIPRVSSWLPSPFIPFRESLNRYRDNFSSTFFYNFMIN